ncbi:Ribonuclease HII [Chlamydiales bacterium STE3]|nr:Ribonuclease HII [Chlamydiales bacterium STE3]
MARVTKRLRNLVKFEEEVRQQGYKMIAGIDEAGRGPLAGPVTAAACIIPEGCFFPNINDSKKLSASQREALFCQITETPSIFFGIGIINHTMIDAINIYQATIQAMLLAVKNLVVKADFLLVDGLSLPHEDIPAKKIIKGDTLSQSIMAAAILAKVTRDRLMIKYDEEWPEYGFKQHKGYSTKQHFEALKLYGPSPIHRNFKPVQALKGLQAAWNSN